MMVRRQEGSAQDGVVPVKNDAGLAGLGLFAWPQPYLVIREARQESVSDLLIRAGGRADVATQVSEPSLDVLGV